MAKAWIAIKRTGLVAAAAAGPADARFCAATLQWIEINLDAL